MVSSCWKDKTIDEIDIGCALKNSGKRCILRWPVPEWAFDEALVDTSLTCGVMQKWHQTHMHYINSKHWNPFQRSPGSLQSSSLWWTFSTYAESLQNLKRYSKGCFTPNASNLLSTMVSYWVCFQYRRLTIHWSKSPTIFHMGIAHLAFISRLEKQTHKSRGTY